MAATTAPAAEPDPASYVDPMIGTHPPGFVVPGAIAPFGMVQNSPDTEGSGFAYSGYLGTDPLIRGFSLVHLSGPGVKKGGDIPFMPSIGPVLSNEPAEYGSTFSHAREEAEAGYYSVELDKPATKVELTASTRAAMQRYTFPPVPLANVIVDVPRSVEGVREGKLEFTGPDEISGSVKGRYPVYFVAKFSRPFTDKGSFANGGGWVSFDALQEREVTMRAGISFVDLDGARRNLEAEAPDFDFDAMRAATREAWNRELSTVRVSGGGTAERTSFYTALYHAQLHPNVFTDVDGRYLGFDGQPHDAGGRTQYANFSSWDTYKAQNQLLALIQPRRYREMLESLLVDAREGGHLPRWGEHNFDAAHMSGDPAIPMIADASCRGLLDRATTRELYAEAVELRSRRPAELDLLGYLPGRPGTTLEYGVADFALALIAGGLGHDAEAAQWRERSLNYRNVFDPQTRWVRPRNADGSWHEPFLINDETGFQEGNTTQYSWLAPHDARGLYDLMGGDAVAVRRLDKLFALPPDVQNQVNGFGTTYRTPQYAPGNEHDIQMPWMYPFARTPWKGAREHRDIQTLFRPTPDGLPGNDDLGSLSAWHAFSALGFGPVTPGAPFYVLGSPQFDGALIAPRGGKRFRIESSGASLVNKYVRGAKLDGREIDRAWFRDASVRDGGRLELEMGATPDKSWASSERSVPPSASDSPLRRFGCSPR